MRQQEGLHLPYCPDQTKYFHVVVTDPVLDENFSLRLRNCLGKEPTRTVDPEGPTTYFLKVDFSKK